MKLHTWFHRGQSKQERNETVSTQPVPIQPSVPKELTQQELEQVQGGNVQASEIVIKKYIDKASPILAK
jgi:bacteriocin-like protein